MRPRNRRSHLENLGCLYLGRVLARLDGLPGLSAELCLSAPMAEEFCAVTGASESEAAEYLERCNGDGKLAMERFFEESKAIEQRRIREGDLGDADEAAEALAAVGVTVTAGASLQTMREALKAHYKGKDMTPRQVFDSLDEDSSGFLDRAEVEKASGVLGAGLGFIMSAEELDKQFTACGVYG